MPSIDRVLVVGATGRTGQHVVAAATARGLTAVALARSASRARKALPPGTEIVVGDLTAPDTLTAAVRDIDAVIFVHGSDDDARPESFERIDYGGVSNVLRALGERRPRIVLQTTIFVTRRDQSFNDGGHALDWKRRSERLVRLSGAPYTIVRPGWLDAGEGGAHLRIEQGDTGEDGVSREALGGLLVEALLDDAAIGKTFEVFSGPGWATKDFTALFAKAQPDLSGALDAVKDTANLPLDAEPARVREDLAHLRTH
ncbi:SDR family oxidoreductase [Streptomyces chromofuscus]|uniref:SDR family oxidoreductase n=1 Tax=Streptomyces chromofuscus TaxID=42881 RepID=A0A7M2T5T0_STRCW|nr:SDR family oxidoreductase [Streptomyces chromofuscus]QOV43509.1 SDR family oxidoreductase [Streptomyces chromofuscus]GGT10086.1 NAD-dependent dehydratase [Streptomyces chromofuscus]